MIKICVMGLWHLGCVTAACLSSMGVEVIGLTEDNDSCRSLYEGKLPIYEPGMDDLIRQSIHAGRLSFTSDISEAVTGADYIWICYDTPVDDDDNADVGYVLERIKSLKPYVDGTQSIIISSQLPVGSVRLLEEYFGNTRFACSPENLRLGKAIKVFCEPDRIVVGVRSEYDREIFEPVFRLISDNLIWMKTESAEMTKHALNGFLATSVAYINEIASLCEYVGADASEVSKGLKSEERIGYKSYLAPGTAFAGGTLARDLRFMIDLSDECGINLPQIKGTKISNDDHKNWIYNKLGRILGKLKNKRILILGLAYKRDTSTLRRSLAIELAEKIISAGGMVFGYDPNVSVLSEDVCDIRLMDSFEKCVGIADCIVIMLDYQEFGDIIKMNDVPVIDENGFFMRDNIDNQCYYMVGKG